jgi:hypothetical protein
MTISYTDKIVCISEEATKNYSDYRLNELRDFVSLAGYELKISTTC